MKRSLFKQRRRSNETIGSGSAGVLYNKPITRRINNGAVIVGQEMPGIDTAIILAMPFGYSDNPYLPHFLEHLTFRSKFPGSFHSSDIEIGRLSGIYDGYTTLDCMVLSVNVINKNAKDALRILLHSAMTPAIFDESLNKERRIIAGELRERRSNPNFSLDESLEYALFSNTGISLDTETLKGIKDVSAEELKEFRKKYIGAKNLHLAIVGGNVRKSLDYAESIISEFPNKGHKLHRFKLPETYSGIEINIKKGGYETTTIKIGALTPGYGTDEVLYDRLCIEAALNILWGSANEYGSRSKLWSVLRDKMGIIYSTISTSSLYSGIGFAECSIGGITTKYLGDVKSSILDEIEKLGRFPISDRIVNEAVDSLIVNEARLLLSSHINVAEYLLFSTMGNENPMFRRYEKTLRSLTPNDIRVATRKYLNSDRLFVATLSGA